MTYSHFFSKNALIAFCLPVLLCISSTYGVKKDLALTLAFPNNGKNIIVSQNNKPLFLVHVMYFFGADEYFLDPGRGRSMCTRNDGMDLALSFPPRQEDVDRLFSGIITHNREKGFSGCFNKKIFFVALSSKSSKKQLYGAVCVQIVDNLFIIKIGNSMRDEQSLHAFMDYLEMEAYSRNLKRIMIQISSKNCYFYDILASGFSVKGSLPDFHDGDSVLLGKDVSENFLLQKSCGNVNTDYEFFQRDIGCNNTIDFVEYQNAKKDFFSMPLVSCDSDVEGVSLDAGLFVYDVTGKNCGGCCVKIFNKDKISHVYIDLVWLDQKIRGGGIAKKILCSIEQWAKKKFGCRYSHLTTAEYQAPWLYKKCGYTAAITYPNYIQTTDGNAYSSYMFIKEL